MVTLTLLLLFVIVLCMSVCIYSPHFPPHVPAVQPTLDESKADTGFTAAFAVASEQVRHPPICLSTHIACLLMLTILTCAGHVSSCCIPISLSLPRRRFSNLICAFFVRDGDLRDA